MNSTIDNRKSAMELAYIAGPYRAANEFGVHQNIQLAERAAAHAWRKGYAAICPHKNSAYMGGVVADEVILAGDLEMLRRSDVIILCGEWYRSAGACGEVAEAIRMGLALYEYHEQAGWPPRLMVMQAPDVTRRMARHDYTIEGNESARRQGNNDHSVQVSDGACDDGQVFGGGALLASSGTRNKVLNEVIERHGGTRVDCRA